MHPYRSLVLSLTGVLLFVGGTWAQPGGSGALEEARARKKAEALRLEAEVRRTLGEALLPESRPDAVAAALRGHLARLETDDLLEPGTRQSLIATVKERLRGVEGRMRAAAAGADVPAPIPPARGPRDDEYRKHLEAINAIRTGIAGAIEKQNQFLRDKEARTVAVLIDVDRSGSPPKGDIEYGENWVKISGDRLRKYEEGKKPFTDKEKEILAALDQVISGPVEMKNVSFEDVLKFLRKAIGQPISVNQAALDEMRLTYESPLTVSVSAGVTKRTMLRRILADAGLTYIIKNEQIEITSQFRAKDEMTTRTYDLGDIALGPNGRQQIQLIMDTIQNSIDPASWQKNGGAGSVVFVPPGTLIIKNTAEVHGMLGIGRAKKK